MRPRSAATFAVLMLVSALPAHAQASDPVYQGSLPDPYMLGVSQGWTRESNLFRMPDGALPSSPIEGRSDVISTTALLASLDRSLGRQRVRGNATLKHNEFRKNKQFNNDSHALSMALDWATLDHLSGNVSVASNRSLRRFDPSEASAASERNVETVALADAAFRLGVVTRATLEANLNHRRVEYSSTKFSDRAYKQDTASFGGRYRPAAATTIGLGLRFTEGRYTSSDDRYERRDIDLTGRYEPGDGTVISGRVSLGKTEYDRFTERNYSGPSGAIGVLWQPTSKIRVSARASRDTGQDSAFLTDGTDGVVGLADYSRTTTSARLQTTYLATAKTQLHISTSHSRRALVTELLGMHGASVAEGSDRVTQWQIGPSWAPTRSLQFGCDLTHERRSARGVGSSPYRSNGASCYGQLVMFPG